MNIRIKGQPERLTGMPVDPLGNTVAATVTPYLNLKHR